MVHDVLYSSFANAFHARSREQILVPDNETEVSGGMLSPLAADPIEPRRLATIWRAVKQLGFTVKKNGTRVRTRSPRRRGRPRAVGDDCPDARPDASSFWMKAGSPPISCGAMGAAFAASGSPITRPRVGGRAVPSSPRCG